MDAFAKYSLIDWLIMFQVVLIWFYMASQAGRWIMGLVIRKGWRWWNRSDEKTLALDSFYEAFGLGDIKPGQGIEVTTQSGMIISIKKPK